MSQYSSRLHIKVSSPEVWRRFRGEGEYDAGLDMVEFADTKDTSFIIDADVGWSEGELDGIVVALAEILGKDGIVIADTTNINVDSYNYCVLYLGEGIHSDVYDCGNKCEMHDETDISDIVDWLSYGEFNISNEEREQMSKCGIDWRIQSQ